MKTEPASLPLSLPSAGMLFSDEVVFRHKGTDGKEGQVRVPLAVGLLYAANAMRSGEPFALGYPGDRLGRLARRVGGQLVMDKDVIDTFDGMVKFLDSYTEVLVAQVRAEPALASRTGARVPEEPGGMAEKFSSSAE